MNSARTMPCVLVLPPRSKPPGFHRPRHLLAGSSSMIESTNSSSPGKQPFLGQRRGSRRALRRLISAVTRRAIGSRSSASNAGRTQGSKRRSQLQQLERRYRTARLRNAEPVLARRHRAAGVRVHGGPLIAGMRQEAQRADSRQEEVGAAAHGHELRQAGEARAGAVGLRHARSASRAASPGAAAGDCRAAGRSRSRRPSNALADARRSARTRTVAAMLAFRHMKCSPRLGSSPAARSASACSGVTATPYSRPRRSSR